ncbi:transposase [Marinimicrobium sp. C6131]|uniref:transposase n=1 Tax=Marinimicrobium sp. C6131 TaxID=3022676 RepID=UPI00223D2A26|nr:transposase [Marinimicrobium sp. C6131]UZJ45317.1 transposase [Marinimicrobium sp. C6131]
MPRRPRPYLPGYPQHVIQRGNNRSACFADEKDYKVYLKYLREAAEQCQVALHAYVLMSNHVHLLLTPSDESGVARMMQALGRRYVQYFNKSYERTGTLWEGRYRSTLVDSESYLLAAYRYIELNPVRAGMVDHPSEYPWSSYAHNAVGRTDARITPHPGYEALGAHPKRRQEAYRALFEEILPKSDVQKITEATERAWVLGSERFKRDFERRTGRPAAARPKGGDRKSADWKKTKGVRVV